MKRRDFIKKSSFASIPFGLKGLNLFSINEGFITGLDGISDLDKVLVVIRLNGGNDGLNTVIPVNQYDKLYNQRENIIIPENKLIEIESNISLHPSLEGFSNLYSEDKLTIVQNVGYPNPNRSHFRSSDIITSGSASDQYITSGWLGRYFDSQFDENNIGDDPIAISMSSAISEICEGLETNYSLALNDPKLAFLDSSSCEPLSPSYSRLLDHIDQVKKQSNVYAQQLDLAYSKGNNLVEYSNNQLSNQLKIVARLLHGGLKTKVFVLDLNGFDTHSNQVLASDTTEGKHAELLSELSTSIQSFTSDLEKMFLDHKVLGMAYSEFGRPIKSNASYGSDHGDAGPVFLFGRCLTEKIIGENPIIPELVEVQEGIPMEIDFRSVFSSILLQWFGLKSENLNSIFSENFANITLVENCNPLGIQGPKANIRDSENNFCSISPNPATTKLHVEFNSVQNINQDGFCRIFSIQGKLVLEKELKEELHVDISMLEPNTYLVLVNSGKNSHSQKIIKQ